jgi:hypothetical protein
MVFGDFFVVGYEGYRGQAYEQAMLHDSGDVIQLGA